MDIQTFSTTYWYIWLIVVLLIVLLVLINGVGVYLYRKKRQRFLQQSNLINDNIPMRKPSNASTMTLDYAKYRQMSTVSTRKPRSRLSNSRVHPPPPYTIKSSGKSISTIHETNVNDQSESLSNEKDDIDLTLEEFQRQALKEHNNMRALRNKPPLKLAESLNIYAQYWAEQCARTNVIKPSNHDWRSHCKGEPLGENIVSMNSNDVFDGSRFTFLLMANGDQSHEVGCILNELTTEVGFGRTKSQTQSSQWIGVAHYYPYRQLTTVQS
ncbi:hypothetical protein I4U23_026855 [Adineta vaga]|nr:hypothetical protein I4U23_026855 [Adineta vaga]